MLLKLEWKTDETVDVFQMISLYQAWTTTFLRSSKNTDRNTCTAHAHKSVKAHGKTLGSLWRSCGWRVVYLAKTDRVHSSQTVHTYTYTCAHAYYDSFLLWKKTLMGGKGWEFFVSVKQLLSAFLFFFCFGTCYCSHTTCLLLIFPWQVLSCRFCSWRFFYWHVATYNQPN